ncbi:hypothetical protein ACIBP4_29525 [Micromonospora maritima]|uniref:Uncharacterized protein n=1 Tax=Micromonospora maritima TaxID=986711 RepID=A0ABW7ZUC4_9ACTN
MSEIATAPRRLVLVVTLALVVSVALLVGGEALTALAEGFGWGNPPASTTEVTGWAAGLSARKGL